MKLVKTSAGQQTLKDRSAALTPRQRTAFILFDGTRSTAQVLAATEGIGLTMADVDCLVGLGLLTQALNAVQIRPPLEPGGTALTGAERYSRAYPIAAQLTSGLGLRGYRLNLAVEGAADDVQLLALLPKIQDAVGMEKCRALEQALKG